MLPVPLFQLQCGTNSYDWGKIGNDSAAARFAAATTQSGFKIEESKPYAELWMGTHPSNPSKDVTTGRTLLDLVTENKALLSTSISEIYGDKLPFLFKVLSIQKALSIQAHPDKKLAERLHKQDPKNYPDDNHKPEMAIAVTAFDGFCGFRPLAEISSFLQSTPALRSLLSEEVCDAFTSTVASTSSDDVTTNKAALKELFSALMNTPESRIAELAPKLVGQAKECPGNFGGEEYGGPKLAQLIVRLNEQFPDDIGLFCTFFLNYVELSPGEAIFLKADDPHAYLSGDIIECMAASDNVVRAGFTPKFKDVPNLVEMLTYSYAPISEQKMKPQVYAGGSNHAAAEPTSVLYDPPIDEFSVIKTELKEGQAETFEPIEGPSIVICTSGGGQISVGPKKEKVERGHVYFVGATAKVVLTAEDGQAEPFNTFRAFTEVK
ncbi:mannose-6-phosphate isomerase [Morchella conica CCBAS932]|uniref:Mannose-6-phosphate isomerase n=1 Tax=Morchella conica CCBAS932 TaxID=1392247 RepID=A0A3N4KNN1_9PEZI|nr:mannose-6-phosphate isomerase [Morchella conica CCBAS932]